MWMPQHLLRWGENLPTGVAREWGAWCLEYKYLAAYFDQSGHRTSPDGTPFGPVYFDQANCPILAYYFTDDPIATEANAAPMLSLFNNATIETTWISPETLELDEIGHLGFFRQKIGAPLWDDTLTWLQLKAAAS